MDRSCGFVPAAVGLEHPLVYIACGCSCATVPGAIPKPGMNWHEQATGQRPYTKDTCMHRCRRGIPITWLGNGDSFTQSHAVSAAPKPGQAVADCKPADCKAHAASRDEYSTGTLLPTHRPLCSSAAYKAHLPWQCQGPQPTR